MHSPLHGGVTTEESKMPVSRNVAGLVVACGLVFGGYKAIVLTNENAALTVGKARCVEFAKERNVFTAGEAEAMEAWTKHDGRHVVVELSNGDAKPFETHICVKSKYAVGIVSRLEEHVWY
jgi:hypothetical protein